MIDLTALSPAERLNPTTEAEGERRSKATGLSLDGRSDPFGDGSLLPPGRLTPPDQDALLRYGKGASLAVDLGTYRGRSAVILAKGASKVVTIDNYCFEEATPEIRAGLMRHANITAMHCDTRAAAATFASGAVDLLFIDGDHRRDSVLRDYAAWQETLRAGAYVLFHDYCLLWPEVVHAVNTLLAAGSLREVETCGWILVTEKQ